MRSPKRIRALTALAAASALSLQALAGQCRLPPVPSRIPDGSTSNQQQMVVAMDTIRQYNSDVRTYLDCLKFEVRQKELSTVDQMTLHNTAINQLTRVADAFNRQVRIFKAKHG